jgi:methionine-rich copper-binding protein CopC
VSTRHARRILAPIAAIILVGLCVAPVLGHAELATANPADKSTVTGSPPEIVFTFTENVVPANSSLKLVNSSGAIVAGGSIVDPKDPKTLRLTVSPQPPGAYTVRWTTKSAADGDIAHGATTFTIIAPPSSPSVAPSATPIRSAEPATPSPSVVAPSPSPSPSGGTGTTTAESDAVIPVIGALILLVMLGTWLLRSRSRRIP